MNQGKAIPVVPGHFLLGCIPEFKKDALGFMKKAFDEHGGVVELRVGRSPLYLISDPDLVKQVMVDNKDIFVKVYDMNRRRGLALVMGNGLVNSKGPVWQRQRRMMQPMFHRKPIAAMAKEMADQGNKMIHHLQQQNMATVDMMTTMSDVTLNIISRTMFSDEFDNLHQLFKSHIDFLLAYSQANFFHPMPLPRWVPSAKNLRFNTAMHKITAAIEEMIEARRNNTSAAGDLLNVLLQAKDDETGEAMSTQQIVDECFTIFGAGHETTATALTWATYLIATHPEVENRLSAELEAVLQGKTPEAEDLENLPYTHAVLEETMRFFPSIVSLLRRLESDIDINGYHFSKDAFSLVNIYNIHHHPDYWDDSETFRPERFLGSEKASNNRYSYIPFGIGERVCIGNHFAMMEAMILLVQLCQHFKFSYMGEKAPKPKLAISLRPQGGMPIKLIARP